MLDQIKLKGGGCCYMREELTSYQQRLFVKVQGEMFGDLSKADAGALRLAGSVAVAVEKFDGIEGLEEWPALVTSADLDERIKKIERCLTMRQLKHLSDQIADRLYLGEEEEGN